MFRSLLQDAKAAAGSVISRYVIRASVAVPFLVAAGFGTAALTLILTERYGATAAYGLMASGFAVIGLLSALLVTIKEQEEGVADAESAKSDTAEVATEAATQAAMQLPLALAGALMTTPLGPQAAMRTLKLLARNLPLVGLLLVIGFLLWPDKTSQGAGAEAQPDMGGDGTEAPPPPYQAPPEARVFNGLDRHAA